MGGGEGGGVLLFVSCMVIVRARTEGGVAHDLLLQQPRCLNCSIPGGAAIHTSCCTSPCRHYACTYQYALAFGLVAVHRIPQRQINVK